MLYINGTFELWAFFYLFFIFKHCSRFILYTHTHKLWVQNKWNCVFCLPQCHNVNPKCVFYSSLILVWGVWEICSDCMATGPCDLWRALWKPFASPFLVLVSFVISQSCLDCVFSQHAAVWFHRKKAEFSNNICVFDCQGFLHCLPFYPFSGSWTRCNCRTTAECFKPGSTIFPFSFTWIYDFINSPHAGAPTYSEPPFLGVLSIKPSFLEFS